MIALIKSITHCGMSLIPFRTDSGGPNGLTTLKETIISMNEYFFIEFKSVIDGLGPMIEPDGQGSNRTSTIMH